MSEHRYLTEPSHTAPLAALYPAAYRNGLVTGETGSTDKPTHKSHRRRRLVPAPTHTQSNAVRSTLPVTYG